MLSGEIQIRVRYAETDRMGLLHHANYLVYFEQARTELLRTRGAAYRELEDEGFFLVIAKVAINYRSPAHYDDLLTIRTTVTRTTPIRLEHRYEVFREDSLICEGTTTLACVNAEGKLQGHASLVDGCEVTSSQPVMTLRLESATWEIIVRRFWIHNVLPVAFAAIPVLAAALLLAAIPSNALRLYADRVATSPIDWIIIGLGFSLFAVQIGMSWKALRWRETEGDFDHRADRWVNHLSQAAEWFPLLGLIGTVIAILLTFSAIQPDRNPAASEIIQNYAPAITATGGGLYMAFINILPYWVVGAGRDLIRSLGGYAPPPEPEAGEKK